jgi:integrase
MPTAWRDPVGIWFHPLGVVIVAGDDSLDVAGEPVIVQVGGDRRARVVADDGDRATGAAGGNDEVRRSAPSRSLRATSGAGIPAKIEQGVHIRVVQEVLGHTRVTTTERYTHVATLQMKDASERLGHALWGE